MMSSTLLNVFRSFRAGYPDDAALAAAAGVAEAQVRAWLAADAVTGDAQALEAALVALGADLMVIVPMATAGRRSAASAPAVAG